MFGLTIEKLFVVLICATLILGPQRLPLYAGKIAGIVRGLRGYVEATKQRAEGEMGVSLNRADWEALDLRQYDPRTIMRNALTPSVRSESDPATEALTETDADDSGLSGSTPQEPAEPRGVWVVRGDAAHPRRVFLPDPQPLTPRIHPGETASSNIDPSASVTAGLNDAPRLSSPSSP